MSERSDGNKGKEYQEETKKLKESVESIRNEYSQEIEQIEEMTLMTCDKLLFNSDVCNWNQYSSTFDKRIFGKEKITIMIKMKKEIYLVNI